MAFAAMTMRSREVEANGVFVDPHVRKATTVMREARFSHPAVGTTLGAMLAAARV
jgi:hypothetical protein